MIRDLISFPVTCLYMYLHVRNPVPHRRWNPGQETVLWKSSCSFRWPSEVRAAFQGKWTQPYLWPISCLQWGETQDQVMIVAPLGQNKALSSRVSWLQQHITGTISIKRSTETGVLFSDVSLQLLMLCMEALPKIQAASEVLCVMAVDGFPLIHLIFWTHLFLWTLHQWPPHSITIV